MKKIIVLFFLQIGINNGTKTFFSWFCDQTVKWRGSRGLPSSAILATTQENVSVGSHEEKKLMKKNIVLFFLQIGINNGTKTFFGLVEKKLMKKNFVLFFLQIGINKGTKTFFSRFCDQTVKWWRSRGLPSWIILATTQEKKTSILTLAIRVGKV